MAFSLKEKKFYVLKIFVSLERK